jgi:pyridoxamine 5'-phosphate oxidase
MTKNVQISSLREDYTKAILLEEDVLSDPFKQFEKWFAEAVECKVHEPNAMHLATTNANNLPDGRIVLLKNFNAQGLSFFTNYESQKGADLVQNPFAAVTFFWPELERQIRIRGSVKRVPEVESVNYFNERPRKSQLGAWSSSQSKVIANRAFLDDNYTLFEKKFEGVDIPKPDNWGGFLLSPIYFEFWQGRSSRLHDRITFTQTESMTWEIARLAP